MDTKWASDNLQVIRTLMERSALYRRALAPIMLVSGMLGTIGLGLARFIPGNGQRAFLLYWFTICAVSLVATLLLVRRQALKEAERFWSLPTQRVFEGLFPSFFSGFAVALAAWGSPGTIPTWLIVAVWALTYGCALRAAGFFMQRGIKLFGTGYLILGAGLLFSAPFCPWIREPQSAHALMGVLFGLLHLAYGGYLYFTERRSAS